MIHDNTSKLHIQNWFCVLFLRYHLPISASLSSALDTIIVASALDILPVAACNKTLGVCGNATTSLGNDLGHTLLQLRI